MPPNLPFGGPCMHFHLPKPMHGWREFAGEIAIIVIGVLIALGAEQVLESWHWQHKADETTAAIRDDIAGTYSQAAEAASVAPCVDRQLEILEDAVGQPGFTTAPLYSDASFNHFVVRMPSRPWSDLAWKAATSEGTVSHLPVKRRQAFESFYQQVATMELNARQVDELGWRLRALGRPGGADQRARSIEAMEELRGHIDYMALVANQLMGQVDSIGMRPASSYIAASIQKSGTAKFCRAHGIAIGRPAPEPPS